MIVVEGPDGAGKTTLIQRLCQDMDIHTIPRACTSDEGPVPDLGPWVERNLNRAQNPTEIMDRHPLISEPIYGPLLRGGMSHEYFDRPAWLQLQMEKLYTDHVILYCLPPLKIVLDNIETEHEGTTDHLRGVLEKGRAIWSQYNTRIAVDTAWESSYRRNGFHHILVWDYTIRGSYRDLINNIGRYLDHGAS